MQFNRSRHIARVVASATLVAAMVAPQAAHASTTLKISGSTTVQPLAQKFASAFKRTYPSWVITVAGGGSSVGFNDVIAGRVDIGMSSRDPKESETEKGAITHVVARDSLVIIVNPNNPVRRLTAQQVKDIYHGKIRNWKDVGGPDAPIVLHGRTGASGTYEYFKEAFLGGVRQSARTKGYASNGLVRSGVARSKYGIGYVGIAFVNRTVRGVAIDGVAPTRANALSGKYRYVRPLYFITKGAPTGDVKTFIDWCRGPAGQRVAATEFLPR